MRKAFLLATGAVVALTSTAVTAQYASRPLDPRYVAEAQRDHPKLVAEFGGAETGARAAYVDSVGRKVGAYSGVPNPSLRFTVLNSAVENAFTVPGGYVYITRQLLGLMDDESQLAFALGHEIGHVAAQHAQQREAASRRNSIGSILGVLLGSVVGGSFGNYVAQRSQLSAQLQTLSFSRDQEYQSDTLGIRYMTQAGYDPAGAGGILAAIGRATALEARVQGQDSRQLPEWASTHPLTQNRLQRATAEAQRTRRLGTGLRNRDQFLSQIDGVYVDDDPEQGIIDGRTFTHPDLRIQFAVPVGYLMQNGTREVSIKGSAGQAQFSGGATRAPLNPTSAPS
ncbi:M48 family metalloprotease [Sphingomonas sinipercae]|uniref:M48 family metalloprotease n=1 Tax=Sphingomonas sinipercae TaxID=2714944 RepID=A0A6G7ZPB5_9SPHN|nr:M48 family metalloprotease [Sphingomonas sinipercae]QIL02837.1 M48 family metalloprotease [Sphingomonas sinipercae]